MNFGSKYVYVYEKSDEESVSEDSDSDEEVDSYETDGFHGGDRTQGSRTPSAGGSRINFMGERGHIGASRNYGSNIVHDGIPSNFGQAPREIIDTDGISPAGDLDQGEARPKKRKVRKADPNVFTISVGNYVTPDNLHPNNKTLRCGTCKAIMTAFSKFEAKAGVNDWQCEFCSHVNHDVDLSDWTKPATDDVTFLLEASQVEEVQKTEDDHYVIFVIDISGSMGVSQQVDTPRPTGGSTRRFVSRLDAVKTAAEHQIRQLKEESPNVRVGLVAFGSQIYVFGDGTTPVRGYSDSEMRDSDRLKALASDAHPLKPISETYDVLIPKLLGLEIRGSTALGPGLLTGIGLATNAVGSKVIICTDGCANVGIGTLPSDGGASEIEITRCRMAYTEFGEFAKQHSVSVSVISLEGTDCRLVHLGLVAQMTGGLVDIVDPSRLDSQFGNILTSRTLATDVTINLCLHHTLYFRGADMTDQKSTKVEKVGNVTADTDMIVEFGVRPVTNENENPVTITDEDQHGASGGVDVPSAPSAPPPLRQLSIIPELDTLPMGTDRDTAQGGQVDTMSQEESVGGSGASEPASAPEVIATDSAVQANPPVSSPEASTSTSGLVVAPSLSVEEQAPGPSMNIPAGPSEAASKPLTELPFQLQLHFTSRNATKYLRVVTILKQSTDKREIAESEMNVNIVGAATSKEISSIALAGNYKGAKAAVKSRKKMSSRLQAFSSDRSEMWCDEAEDYQSELNDLEGMLQQQGRTTKQKMKMHYQPRFSGQIVHDSIPSQPQPPRPPPPPQQRQQNMIADDLANQYYSRSSNSMANYAKKQASRPKKST